MIFVGRTQQLSADEYAAVALTFYVDICYLIKFTISSLAQLINFL